MKCFLCGKSGNLDRHHLIGGAYRKKSEKYGLVVYLCHYSCHLYGKDAVHNNRQTMLKLRRYAQKKWIEENNKTTAEWITEFGKNYEE
jgi:hypothetical protein